MSLYTTFHQTLSALTPKKTQIVIGYSGGLDSHVLLHLLARYKQQYPQHEYLAVHVHHGLSSNADDWVTHCETTAQDLGIALVVERVKFTVGKQDSLEAKAREARYDAINSHLTEGAVLLLAQHLDDQLETFLLQLKRGAGIKGLSAMGAEVPFALNHSCTVCRPLLIQPRVELEKYARQYDFCWVEDESNKDTSYDRNFLRHDIIPLLKQRWPHIGHAVHRSAELCAEQQQLADEIAASDLADCHSPTGGLIIHQLVKLSKIRRNNLIRHWLAQGRHPMPSRVHLDTLWREVVHAAEDANPQFNWQGGQFRRYQGILYNLTQYRPLKDVVLPVVMDSGEQSQQNLCLPDGLGELQICTATAGNCVLAPLPTQQVSIRFRGEGKCKPVGRGGSRSLKKLYQEYHVPPWLRDRIPLVYYDDILICAVGLWVCEGYQTNCGIQFKLLTGGV